jgi:flagellar biosynthesis/type III secretory pathway protein FliH
LDRWSDATGEDIVEAVSEVTLDKEGAMVSKAAQEFIAEGRKEGIVIGEASGFEKGEASGFKKGEASGFEKGEASGFEKGEASGLRKAAVTGEAKLLVRQVEHRFGPLPEPLRIRIEHASLPEIEGWSLRVLDAKSLSDVLDEPA